ncbi:hypothetical protein GJAV_G00064190 [Gymnothorax javanicus]|nr:hypothetical protein GJAV_G00064190 [Gymnothorax javanicus]
MSARGGKRYGSGRKRLSPESYVKSAERSDTAFLQHLLSLEMRRQERLNAKQAVNKRAKESDVVQGQDDCNLLSSAHVKRDRNGQSLLAAPVPVESPVTMACSSFCRDLDIIGLDCSGDSSSMCSRSPPTED